MQLCQVWLYLLLNKLHVNTAYRKGLGRVGCIICPFGSDWNDYLCNHIFPETAQPFLCKIREIVGKRGVKDIETYIKSGNWKIRAQLQISVAYFCSIGLYLGHMKKRVAYA